MIYGLIFPEHATITPQVQRGEIVKYAKKHKLKIDEFITYTTLPKINMFESGDSVIFYAWNCISNERAILNNFIRYLLQNNICLYSATSPYYIDQTRDFTQFEYAFNLWEDIRFNMLSNKSRTVIKNRIANGQQVGRAKGSKNTKRVLDGKEKTILRLYSQGQSMYAIAKKMKVSTPTIKRFLTAQA